ncbi:unnamed protein product [Rhodiola kirilowii]
MSLNGETSFPRIIEPEANLSDLINTVGNNVVQAISTGT